MKNTVLRRGFFSRLTWGFLLVGLLFFTAPSYAEEIQVDYAEPSSAEQGTYDLEVTVSGDNFGADSEVDFFVTTTGYPGGIKVKKVKRRGPKTLKVTIDVAPDAVTDDFDIEVRSRGRTGKGTELFRVLKTSKTKSESIIFTGDLIGDQEVEGCCPNAGPFPPYTMTLGPNGFGSHPAYTTYDGEIFMNFMGAGRNRHYVVQFTGDSDSGDHISIEIEGGDIDNDKKAKVLTVTFTNTNATCWDYKNGMFLPVNEIVLVRTSP